MAAAAAINAAQAVTKIAARSTQRAKGSNTFVSTVRSNRRGVVKLLIEVGADAKVGNKRGVTPLMAAAFNGNGSMGAILLKAGADPASLDATGKTATIYAAARGFFKIVAPEH